MAAPRTEPEVTYPRPSKPANPANLTFMLAAIVDRPFIRVVTNELQ
jgi:hypothetical protein